jgi:putative hydrolases of HD superfamily
MNAHILSLLHFLKEADQLKGVERKTLVHHGARLENSAEHSWHLSLAVFVFQSLNPKIQLEKALLMAILHDLVEVDAGDTFVYHESPEKKEKEIRCLERFQKILPLESAEKLAATWMEFEDGQTEEAKFVSALDRFLPLYSNYLNKGFTWKKHDINLAQVEAKNKKLIETALPDLWKVAEVFLNEAVAKGYLKA